MPSGGSGEVAARIVDRTCLRNGRTTADVPREGWPRSEHVRILICADNELQRCLKTGIEVRPGEVELAWSAATSAEP